MKRLAVLLDGGFLRRKLKGALGRMATAQDLADFVALDVMAKIPDHELFRAYYYDARPFAGRYRNPISKISETRKGTTEFDESERLIRQADLLPNFAVRLGECVMQGWEIRSTAVDGWESDSASMAKSVGADDLIPKIKQRGVDLRIGLDIAHLTNLKPVQTVVLVTGDSDFIPAMKYARRGGLRVILHTCGHKNIYEELKKHADLVMLDGPSAPGIPPKPVNPLTGAPDPV